MSAQAAPPIVAVSGRSGSGKTRLLARLLPALARRGVSCAVVKHTRHPHAFDRPGKDTDVLRRAGAVAAAIAGPERMAWFGPAPRGLRALAALMPPVDLVLAEGFRGEPVPRIEVHRRAVSRAFLCARDPRVFAIVTDEPPPRRVPAFGADDVEALADHLCAWLARARGPARARARLRPPRAVSSVPPGRTLAPRERGRMPKRTGRKTATRTAPSRRGGRRRSGSAGGKATLRSRGLEFYSEIGRKGGKRSGAARRARATSRARAPAAPGRRRAAGSRRSRPKR